MKTTIKTVAVLTSITLSSASLAGDWSVGAVAGQSKFKDLGDVCNPLQTIADQPRPIEGGGIECTTDDSSATAGLNIAYNFNEAFGIEAGFVDLGDFDFGTFSFSAGGPLISSDLGLKAKAAYLAATSSYHFTDRWSITGRLGVYELDAKLENLFFANGSVDIDTDTEFYTGASVDYAFADNWTAQFRYDNFDINMLSLGLKYWFR